MTSGRTPAARVTAGAAARQLLARGRNIYLAGFMGTGKSVTARALGSRLGVPWADLDAQIERQAGLSVASIFAQRGEPAFRDLEHEALGCLAAAGGRVVALGGGAVCFPRNRALMRASGVVVVLEASPAVIWRRVGGRGGRPLLSGAGGRPGVEALLRRRRRDYHRYRRRVDTGGLSPRAAAAAVLSALEPARRSDARTCR